MNRDPLYQKIELGLKGRIAPDLFERCASDLLRDTYPTLVPVVGGNDAGMDGAIGTAEGAYPLVTTTEEDVIGNLTESLQTNRERWRGPRRAVAATTQFLTPAKRRNLNERATELGFDLVNIHDGFDFTNRLYRDPKWRMELLGIPGDPPALSVLPLNVRPTSTDRLIGRDSDLAWLRATAGDLLLIGQPGSGKTYLHQAMAANGECLFAVDGDPGRMADAIREQIPTTVVVDDAHVHSELLSHVERLRHELNFNYAIHANAWPGEEAAIRRRLGLSANQMRRLSRLPKALILQIIEKRGIVGPDELLHLFLYQSDGKPGLAVALVEACKRDGTQRVWTGEALADELLADQRLMRDPLAHDVLAAIALGGDAGLSIADVSDGLRLPPPQVRTLIAALGAGGVIEAVDEDRLQVRPEALRAVLVKNVFYSGPESIDAAPFLRRSRSANDTATVLMGARQRDARVPQDVLEEFVCAANSRDCWEHFGWVDEQCARRVIDHFPEHACEAAPGALHFIPAVALPRLLDADVETTSGHEGAIDHPRRRIEEWLTADILSGDRTIARRRLLLTSVRRWMRTDASGKYVTVSWAMSAILQPNFESHRSKPGSPREIVMTFGLLSEDDLLGIVSLWPEILRVVSAVPPSTWRPVLEEIENWCFPQRHLRDKVASEEVYRLMKEHSKKMLTDVLALSTCTRADRQWAAHIATWAELGMEVVVDPLFGVIFKDHDHRTDIGEWQNSRTLELDELAKQFVSRPPSDVAAELGSIEREAADFGRMHAGWDRYWIYRRLAEWCDDPVAWLRSLVAARIPAEFVSSFLSASVDRKTQELVDTVCELLAEPMYEQVAARLLFTSEHCESAAFRTALPKLKLYRVDEYWLAGLKLPVETVSLLLRHEDKEIRLASALGEWRRDGGIRPLLREEWTEAILEIDGELPELDQILIQDSALAMAWMARRIQGAKWNLWRFRDVAKTVAKQLPRIQRRELLLMMVDESFDEDWFDCLMDGDIELFRDWLDANTDDYCRLRPLDRKISELWEKMAIAALDWGCTPEEIADHGTPRSSGIMRGPFSQHYLDQVPAYERLASHEDVRLRPAGERGLQWAKANAEREIARERREEI